MPSRALPFDPVHGIIDDLWGLLPIAAPFALGLPTGGGASWLAWMLGAGAVIYSLLTAYEVGLVPLIPLSLHLGLDALARAALASWR